MNMLLKQAASPQDQDTGTFADGLIGFEAGQTSQVKNTDRDENAYERDYGEHRNINRSAVGFT